ncbi:MAG: hypothetical protein ACRYFK_06180 [Janthinobacterium lividum]
MKLPLLFAALLGLASLGPGHAQQLPTAAPGFRLAPTHADSAVVLHRLFQRNRRAGRYIGLLEAALLPSAIVQAASPDPAAGKFVAGSQVVSTAMISAYFVGYLVRWARFSQRREREALERFEQHQAQPRYVQRHFDQALLLAARPPHKGLFNKLRQL